VIVRSSQVLCKRLKGRLQYYSQTCAFLWLIYPEFNDEKIFFLTLISELKTRLRDVANIKGQQDIQAYMASQKVD
jgi:hypothetical protein